MTAAPDSVDLLRTHGLRSTPQRRAILAAFRGGQTEHLSSDEVHARASQTLPDLSRGTVYAAVAEFTELGLLAAVGLPEPVRYETNTSSHDHFRCRVCLRLFDLGLTPATTRLTQQGFLVERVDTRAEGICADCADYDTGLRTAAQTILTTAPLREALLMRGTAAAEMRSPLGPLLLAATQRGLVRLAFEEHADAGQLRTLATNRRRGVAARRHLDHAANQLGRYLTGESRHVDCTVDWETLADHAPDVLQSTLEIPYAATRSYTDINADRLARQLGETLGGNPVPILTPCHRVTRGVETPNAFVGGAHRRTWLLALEQRGAQA